MRRLFVSDTDQRAVNDGVYADLNELAQFFSAGEGAPSSSPAGPQLYFRRDGGVGTSGYVWDGTSWAAIW